ncbi:hypothetical protein HPB47_003939 [Ixodes persulcatus]|uniref:Uncharacterized protein n=1 Tax=Ixodes persulcatus TaxID=34615 RepID=A0AC60PH55_IXOPE|nr:hypothetical protein HPB47_003939 [Ixodes persulcatus]
MSADSEGIRHVRSIRKMLHIQKDEACAQIKREVADLQQRLLEQLDTAVWIKQVELKKLEEEVQSCSIPLNPLHFFRSTAVRSLLSLDCLRVRDFECASFAYINACEAKPDQLHFVDDYSARVSKTGDMVRVYYVCSLDYDPILFRFLTVLVKDRANNTVSSKNWEAGNGRYMVEFRACGEGSYLVYVKLYGQNICGSPVVIDIQDEDSALLPELSQPCLQVSLPILSQPRREVAMAEPTQSRQEVALPERSQSRVEVSFPEAPQDQDEALVQPQHFYDAGLAMIQQPEAEEVVDSTCSRPTQVTAMDQVTLPEAREAGNLEVATDGQSLRSTNSSEPTLTSAPGCEKEFFGTVSADLILEFKTCNKNDYLSFPIGVSATAEGNIIVGDTGNDRVIVFDAEGRALCKAELPGTVHFKRPSAIVSLDDGSFAVKDDRCVYLFSKAGEYIRTLGKDRLVRPFGLAAHGANELMTLSLDSPAKLWCFSATDDPEAFVVYSPLNPIAPAGSKCRFLEVHEDSVFVADLGLSHVYKTDTKGEGTSIFGKKGKEPGAFCEPSGISASEMGLFIGDSKNNRIQVFDFDGNFMSVVKLSSRIIRPSGIHVSAANKLYVLNYLRGVVGVYDLVIEGTET